MSDEHGGTEGQRPEVVSESVVVVADGREMARRFWGLLVALGVVALVFGLVVLANIWASVHLVAIFAGLFLLFAGVMQLVSRSTGRSRVGRIFAGLLAIVAGIVLIAWPNASVKTVAVVVGVSFLVWGIAVAIAALVDRSEGSGVIASFGALLAVVGVIFIVWPGPTVTILMVLVGASAILFGISTIAQGLALRKL
jgi:uncharacterized membrane protein HdeD (DUF308 family)